MLRGLTWGMALLLLGASAHAAIDVGSDGSDGALNVTTNTEIDLSQAVTAPWNTRSPQPGKGVYDPEKWAVVFKYTSVSIAAGATVTFKNHGSRAPVIWLVQGDVTIDGAMRLDGAGGHRAGVAPTHAEAGPGGFLGGKGNRPEPFEDGSGGFGPGGAFWDDTWGAGGSYATLGGRHQGVRGTPGPTYGNASLVPLIGGSGGAGGRFAGANAGGGGAGGGAILIAANQMVLLRSAARISADGGMGGAADSWGGGGSGGGIRLLADVVSITGNVTLRAAGGTGIYEANGGLGRIRIEGNTISASESVPPATSGTPGPVFPMSESPKLRLVSLAGQPVPADLRGGFFSPNVDMTIGTHETVALQIEATNMDPASTVTVRVGLRNGPPFTSPATLVGGHYQLSTWRAEFALPHGMYAIQVMAKLP